MRKTIFTAIIGCLFALLTIVTLSCSNRNGWSISGVIENAPDTVLVIEESSGAAWLLVDSVNTSSDGSFAYTAVEPYEYGQGIMRIRMGDQVVYFPVEGSESLQLTAKGGDMSKNHRLTGTALADGFNRVDSLFSAAIARVGAQGAMNDSTLISEIGDLILADSTCVVSYYAIRHPIEDKMFFNTDNSRKLGLIGAAATRYATLRPNDPRANELKDIFREAKQSKRSSSKGGATMQASVSGRPSVNFVRRDENGKEQDMNAILDRGGVTVVNMTRYDSPNSTATTAALGDIYNKYKDRGLVIYQISFDPVEANWRENAHKMPWITVYNRPADPTDILVSYNANPVEGTPISFVFNSHGELLSRIVDPGELDAAVAKAF